MHNSRLGLEVGGVWLYSGAHETDIPAEKAKTRAGARLPGALLEYNRQAPFDTEAAQGPLAPLYVNA